MEFVENEEKYFEFIRSLRTDSRVVAGFVEQVVITSDQQKIYMAKYKECYYICLADGEPAGFIGEIDEDIRIAVLPEYQRRGIGTFMVKELLKRNPDSYAKIKIDNEVSQEFFHKIGFKKAFYIMTPPEMEKKA